MAAILKPPGEAEWHAAVRAGDLETVRAHLDAGAAVDVCSDGGITALMLAAGAGYAAIVRLLLDRGADVLAANIFGGTPLLLAALHGHREVVPLLTQAGARIGLVEAVLLGQTDAVQKFLESGMPVDAPNSAGMTALMAAAHRNDRLLAARLLDAGANIEARSRGGQTPLSCAVTQNSLDVAALLLDRGADVHRENQAGWSVLHLAVVARRLPLMRLLLSHGASPDTGGGFITPSQLFGAVYLPESDPAVVALLLESGADVNARNHWGDTPLSKALDNAPAEIIRLLLAHGADSWMSAGEARPSPLQGAILKGRIEIVRVLLDAGADPNADEALLTALRQGHVAIADLLQEHGATADPSAVGPLAAVLQWRGVTSDQIKEVMTDWPPLENTDE